MSKYPTGLMYTVRFAVADVQHSTGSETTMQRTMNHNVQEI